MNPGIHGYSSILGSWKPKSQLEKYIWGIKLLTEDPHGHTEKHMHADGHRQLIK